jgi:hypothetical protein
MTIRDNAIAKLQQLSDPLLQEVSDFTNFVIHKHRTEIADCQPYEALAESWSR